MNFYDLDPLLQASRWSPPDHRGGGDPLRNSLDLVEILGKSGLAVLPKRPSRAVIQDVARKTGLSEKKVTAVYKALVAIGS